MLSTRKIYGWPLSRKGASNHPVVGHEELGFLKKVVQRGNTRDDRHERGRNLWIPGVRPVLLSLDEVFVDCRVEGLLNLGSSAGKLNHAATFGDVVDLKAMRLQPVDCGPQFMIGRAKFPAELFRREPLMEIRRRPVLLLL